MKIMKGERVGACVLVHNTFKVKKACWSFKMKTRTNDKHVDYSYQSA
jgi:hypothetical protein